MSEPVAFGPVDLPTFGPGDDPGPSFASLLHRVRPELDGLRPDELASLAGPAAALTPHGTTIVALRYADGVVMAGDRRATSGNLISHKTIEKVFPADTYSVIGIAGAAGPAMEMVKLFQLQLEHFEKVEGQVLSLDGKANQLGQMLRGNLPAAMQGLVVVPLFGGYDHKREVGRLFQYDITGGRYEEREYAVSGSGSLHAGTVVKLGYNEGHDLDTAVALAISALFQAADEDSATGGPDMIRGIYPIVATVTASGYEQLPDDAVGERFRTLVSDLTGELPS